MLGAVAALVGGGLLLRQFGDVMADKWSYLIFLLCPLMHVFLLTRYGDDKGGKDGSRSHS